MVRVCTTPGSAAVRDFFLNVPFKDTSEEIETSFLRDDVFMSFSQVIPNEVTAVGVTFAAVHPSATASLLTQLAGTLPVGPSRLQIQARGAAGTGRNHRLLTPASAARRAAPQRGSRLCCTVDVMTCPQRTGPVLR